jgi:hypothetical protein
MPKMGPESKAAVGNSAMFADLKCPRVAAFHRFPRTGVCAGWSGLIARCSSRGPEEWERSSCGHRSIQSLLIFCFVCGLLTNDDGIFTRRTLRTIDHCQWFTGHICTLLDLSTSPWYCTDTTSTACNTTTLVDRPSN